MKRQEEKRRRWEFTIPEGGSWQWRVIDPDGSERAIHQGFVTLKACVDDAKHHGYVYGYRRGAKMRNLASHKAAAPETDPTGHALEQPDTPGMFQLLQKLVAADPTDTKLIRKLQQDTRKVLGLENS